MVRFSRRRMTSNRTGEAAMAMEFGAGGVVESHRGRRENDRGKLICHIQH
ncbi:hypothetical protein Taro_017938 [Colocasia esculenta]|uniref:Uncharacterized protein n=1 Tax=Colocasia esculenta TaxID=4460 RepID=A0A843V0Y5_COLES|nr:hypothetical protein [Colocasia esculenta]